VTVAVSLAIFPIKRECNSRALPHSRVNGFQAVADIFERDCFEQRKIEIL
jgi:hypothetical protein